MHKTYVFGKTSVLLHCSTSKPVLNVALTLLASYRMFLRGNPCTARALQTPGWGGDAMAMVPCGNPTPKKLPTGGGEWPTFHTAHGTPP